MIFDKVCLASELPLLRYVAVSFRETCLLREELDFLLPLDLSIILQF